MEIKVLTKNGINRSFRVDDGKVIATVELGGLWVSNPTLQMMYDDGWQDYVPPTPPEPTLEEMKEEKCHEIDRYDSSSAVNEFFIGNASMWLDKNTRAGLMLRIDSEIAVGKETTTLWYDTLSFTMPIRKAKELLYAIEIYASECYDNTARHKAYVLSLTDRESIATYDYTTDYPEKLSLTIDNE